MEYLVFGDEHGRAHGQGGQFGGGHGQPDAVNAQNGGQDEHRRDLEHQRAQEGDQRTVTPSPSAVKKEEAYTLKPMMTKLRAYSRKARLVRASSSGS